MRRLKLQTGGRPSSNDDLQVLQNLSDGSSTSLFKDKGAFILSGCEVDGLDIAPGFVFIDGVLTEYEGGTVEEFPVYMHSAAPIADSSHLHEDGNTKATQEVSTVELSEEAPGSGEYITFTSEGGRTFWDAAAEYLVIKDDAITSAKLADNSVLGVHIVEASVSTAKISNDAVNTVKILNGAVSTAKIADGAISNAKIADGAVTNAKLGGSSVTYSKLGSDVRPLIDGNEIAQISGERSLSVSTSSSSYSSAVTFTATSANLVGSNGRFRIGYSFGALAGTTSHLKVTLERSSNSGFSSPVAIKTISVNVTGAQVVVISAIDTGHTSGTAYYRVKVEPYATGTFYLSAQCDAEIFKVPYVA